MENTNTSDTVNPMNEQTPPAPEAAGTPAQNNPPVTPVQQVSQPAPTTAQNGKSPVDPKTFQALTKDMPGFQNYILPEICKNNFLYRQSQFSCDLPFNFGFPNLDAVQPVTPGFYVLGAISSLGKTTFLSQMADQIAFQGQPVIYFSREMTEFEMLTKSLSRLIYQHVKNDPMYQPYTAFELRKGLANGSRELTEQLDYYATHAKSNMALFKIDSSVNIHDMLALVKKFIETTGKKPVVMIDYMQILGNSIIVLPDGSLRAITDDRENVKRIVTSIKDFQSEHNLMIIGISSLNRMSYTQSISFEAFKETGSIEFTADVIWGLQLSVMTEDKYLIAAKSGGKNEKVSEFEKRKLLSTAKTADIRDISLIALKNRVGVAEYTVDFSYIPKYDTFIPKMTNTTASSADDKSDPDNTDPLDTVTANTSDDAEEQ